MPFLATGSSSIERLRRTESLSFHAQLVKNAGAIFHYQKAGTWPILMRMFLPVIEKWFEDRFGAPSPPQIQGWPEIRTGKNVLIAAPTGSGKTLAAFLCAIDSLMRQGDQLVDETQVLYVSPLKALSNDIRKNLQQPLQEIGVMEPFLPQVRVLVRTGDTPQSERASMLRRPPHILVTTPESLYILLTSRGGRALLKPVRTVIVDEIHSVARDKRGAHLALSLERLESLTGGLQRIGLSATQKPLENMAHLLAGADRDCAIIDAGTFRNLDMGIELPRSPLSAVCSHEMWEEIYERMAQLIEEHHTTLIFVNTRKLAERVAGRLTKVLGEEQVSCHHGSLSKERRLKAEHALKEGKLRALVATASLELGIDIGDVDLMIQIGSSKSIAVFLQRIGRSGHALLKTPKGRLFPLTIDELVESEALLRCVRTGILDRTPMPAKPVDILAQHIVAECVAHDWKEDELFDSYRHAWPYHDMTREEFDTAVSLHTNGRYALLHRDGVGKRLMATKRARLTAILCGGAIPDTADYQVILEPEGTLVGTVNEDWAIESNQGDIFQLGNTSWQVLRVQTGIVRVADAKGQPPTLPFWLGEAPGRTVELSAAVAQLREDMDTTQEQIRDYIEEGKRVLGTVPTQNRVVAERFFDETGGMQLVIHAPFGSRINRAWGLALRKRFCRGFGFELQAAANEEAIILSLGPQHSFPLDEVFRYLHPNTARDVLIQALLAAPMFATRWRWNAQRSLLLERMRSGKRVPAAILRMRSDDLLTAAYPQVNACFETLPQGDLPVPDHPLVQQTIEDCLNEAMDVEGFLDVIRKLHSGEIEQVAVDTIQPSAFARGILSAQPYTFLDDAPLEERRTQAVYARRTLDAKTADELGALDPEAIRRVREEAWPQPENAEEAHEALLWMGFITDQEATEYGWRPWLQELGARVSLEDDRWFAFEASRDPKTVLRGRLEALGPVFSEDPILLELEREGLVLRGRFEGRPGWCHRRLLARIHLYTLERLRREIEPVSAADFLRFLACWQHVDEEHKLEGPMGVVEAIKQLAGCDVPAAAWESNVLPARIRGYKREWLDQSTLTGEVAWGRLWGEGAAAIRVIPICLVPQEDVESWFGLSKPPVGAALSEYAKTILEILRKEGASFLRKTGMIQGHVEMGLAELIASGLASCDSFAGLRQLMIPTSRRKRPVTPVGRWSLFRNGQFEPPSEEFVARRLLKRTGVVFRRTLLREKQPIPWRDLLRVFRTLEARGEIRGGRFVAGFDGEQYALPEAVTLLRAVRKRPHTGPVNVSAGDPLNYRGILTPEERISPLTRKLIEMIPTTV